MKQKRPIGILSALLAASLSTSFHSYKTAESNISKDMSQALAIAMSQQRQDVISEDTIRTFNSHLQTEQLRGKATLAVDTRQQPFACYAQCSAATIFALSDQRPASVLGLSAMLWAVFCVYLRHKEGTAANAAMAYGGLTYSDEDGQFLSATGAPIRLTPMQQQLMVMFFKSPSHRLAISHICDTLWPKKPDATDTLYTLIRRLRPIIEEHSSLKIESDRGRSYQLTASDLG